MIIRSLLRRPGTLSPFIGAPTRILSPLSTRSLHQRPTLAGHEELRKNGIRKFLSPEGFKIAFDDYQEYLAEELNAATDGLPEQNSTVQDLIIQSARSPAHASLFNFASAAFNNHFFFNGISTNPQIQSRPTSELMALIRKDFSSLETFREEMIVHAEAMFGPGFVWLVQVNNSLDTQLRILPTYLAGSPLSGAHYRRQEHNLANHNPDSYQEINSAGSFGRAAQKPTGPTKPLGGVDITPLLCVNTWEHVWLHDYGIKGKRKYLEAWWRNINWEIVQQKVTFPVVTKNYPANKFTQ